MCRSNINQTYINCFSISSEEDLSNTLRSFRKMDSKIFKVSDEDRLSRDYKNCLTCLNLMTVYKEGKYDVPML